MKKTVRNIYLGLILFLMYAPIVTLIVLSFNASKSRAKWGGFTLKWYASLFQDKAIMTALYNTLIIALLSAVLATVVGTAASIGINAMKGRSKTIMMGITNIPILNSEIVTGISLMLLFIAFRVTLGFSTILLAHITFCIPYVILSVMPKLKQTSKSTYEAAQDLGAGPVSAFFKVVFPDILPGIVSGFLMAFTMSLDDFIITHFTKGPGCGHPLHQNLRRSTKGNPSGNVCLVHTAFCQCTGADDTGQYKSERTKRQKNGFQKKVPAARTASGDSPAACGCAGKRRAPFITSQAPKMPAAKS